MQDADDDSHSDSDRGDGPVDGPPAPAQTVKTPVVRGQRPKRRRADGSDDELDDSVGRDGPSGGNHVAPPPTDMNRMTITLRFVPLLLPLSPVQLQHIGIVRGPPREFIVHLCIRDYL